MAQYTKSQLVSASNATYFTNTSGGISASAVRDLNDSWISSSALLSGSNTFIGNQIISGSLTAQLADGFIYLGQPNGFSLAVSTSSISLQGAQGIQGLQGTQGTQGIQGIQGLEGLQGAQGLQGLQGIQGIQGADNSTQGAQGTQGIQGIQGTNGLTGSDGAQGTQGIQGIQGADNSTQGAQGTQGVQGFTGAQGIQGITGLSGSNGAQGAQGIQGVQGTQGDNVSSSSLLVTASFASTNITFTKGDATQFSLPGFATTGSNTFTGNQNIYSTSGTTPLVISSSAMFGIELVNQGLKISGNGGPRLSFPNDMFFNGNVADDMQLTGDTDNPNTRGIDFFLYGTGSRAMRFRNNSGPGATMEFSSHSGSMGFTANNNNIDFTAGGNVNISGSNVNIQNLRYPATDGTNGQAIITNGSGILTFGTVSSGSAINTGSFATTGSNQFNGNQSISGSLNVSGSTTFIGGDANFTDQNHNVNIDVDRTIIKGQKPTLISSSLDISGSLTASLANGFTYVGNASGRTTLVATSSFGGGGTTYENPTLNPYSGSLILVANTFTSSSFAHISASANGQVNLVFKNNNITADTILSGSNNIFVNPAVPTTGFKRYVGGSGNIMLNPSNVPQRSGSMGFSPVMNNNYFGGINTTVNMRGPVSSSTYTISGNQIVGNVNIGTTAANNAEKLTSGLNLNNNSIAGLLNIIANQTALTGSITTFSSNILNGAANLTLSSSAVNFQNNIINDVGFILTNQFFSSSAGLGTVPISRNNIGGQGNSIIITGGQPSGSTTGNSISDNIIFGGTNTIYIDVANSRVSGSTSYQLAIRNGLIGNNLIVSGSSLLGDASSYGSVFVGRFNADDSIRNKTSDIVFAVGTGNTTTRKTGFHIDSGSNTFVEGTFNVSGSTAMNGNQDITGSLLVSSFTTLASVSSSLDFADDTAAGAGGVPLGGLYRNGNFVMIRLT